MRTTYGPTLRSEVRILLGLMCGAFLLVILNHAFLLNPGSASPNGDPVGTVISVLWYLGWAVGAGGIGALAGWIAGRLEPLIAISSVVISTALLWFLPPLFWFVYPHLRDVGGLGATAILINIPVFVFTLVGGTVAFFARRTDLR